LFSTQISGENLTNNKRCVTFFLYPATIVLKTKNILDKGDREMANKKVAFVIGTALVIGLLTGCGTGSKTNGGTVESKTETSKEEKITAKWLPSIDIKEMDHDMIVRYSVKNTSGKKQTLTFPSGLKADFIVYDQNGNKIKQYSEGVSSTQAVEEVELETNKELIQEFSLADLINGDYKIEVFLTSREEKAKVEAEIVIKNSAFLQGSGTLVGQMDPHTIEVDINGNKMAFQLSDEAIQQLESMKEGTSVSFIYIEKENGQKTIEKFLMNS
jgi:hypothetical protein